MSKYGVGHIVVIFTIDFYEEKLNYVQVYYVTELYNSTFNTPLRAYTS